MPATAAALSRSECAVNGIVSTIGPDTYVQGSGFRVQGSGIRDQGPGFRVQGSGFRVLRPGIAVPLGVGWPRHLLDGAVGGVAGLGAYLGARAETTILVT